MISKFKVTNFRSLRNFSVELNPLTVLIGKNDTGKTNLLRALAFWSDIVGGERIDKLSLEGLTTADSGSDEISFTVAARGPSVGDVSIGHTLTLNVRDASVMSEEMLGGEAFARVRKRKDDWSVEASAGPGGPAKGQSSSVQPPSSAMSLALGAPVIPGLTAISAAMRSTSIYRLDASAMKSPSALSSGLESNGQGLATALDDLLSADRAAFGRIEKELCDALGSVRALNLRKCVVEVWRNSSSDQRHRTRDSGKELMFRIAGGAEVPASRISDGVILLLGYLVLMGSTSENRILLLEEPENGIHPTQLGRIAGHLKRLTGAGGRQIVVATHSPYLLDHVPPESVVVMGRQPNGDSRAARLLDIPSAKARLDGGFSLGELWFNVGEEALLDEAERAR